MKKNILLAAVILLLCSCTYKTYKFDIEGGYPDKQKPIKKLKDITIYSEGLKLYDNNKSKIEFDKEMNTVTENVTVDFFEGNFQNRKTGRNTGHYDTSRPEYSKYNKAPFLENNLMIRNNNPMKLPSGNFGEHALFVLTLGFYPITDYDFEKYTVAVNVNGKYSVYDVNYSSKESTGIIFILLGPILSNKFKTSNECIKDVLPVLVKNTVRHPQQKQTKLKDLREVLDTTYPSLSGLAPGSGKAQEEQKDTVKELKLPLEVETVKYGIKMRLIPAGSFMMGSPITEQGRSNDELQHKVTISKPFYMGKWEVTQEQWEEVMRNNPSKNIKFSRSMGNRVLWEFPGYPVDNVTGPECREFLDKLCNKLGVPRGTYRLPTEAEWEYVCRAGTKTPFYSVDKADQSFNYNRKLEPIFENYKIKKGPRSPSSDSKISINAFGLINIPGNLREWCSDYYSDYSDKELIDPKESNTELNQVVRGGSWKTDMETCRSAYRGKENQSFKSDDIGFRVVRVITEKY